MSAEPNILIIDRIPIKYFKFPVDTFFINCYSFKHKIIRDVEEKSKRVNTPTESSRLVRGSRG